MLPSSRRAIASAVLAPGRTRDPEITVAYLSQLTVRLLTRDLDLLPRLPILSSRALVGLSPSPSSPEQQLLCLAPRHVRGTPSHRAQIARHLSEEPHLADRFPRMLTPVQVQCDQR